MRKSFIPKKFEVPDNIKLGEHTLHLIKTKDVMEDWVAIVNNADIITQLRGGSRDGWPYKCTLEEDYKDLAWLEICATYRQLFCYILRNMKGTYIGCIYIYPIDLFYPEKAKKYDVDLTVWVTQNEYDKGNYGKIFKKSLDWVNKDWPFDKARIYLRNLEIPDPVK